MIESLKPYAKTVVSFLIAVVLGAIAQGLLDGTVAAWAAVVIGALSTVGVFAKSNTVAG